MYEGITCEDFVIIVNKEGLEKARLLPDLTKMPDSPKNLKERLERWKDISCVDLIFSEKKTKGRLLRDNIYIAVPWYWPKGKKAYEDKYNFTNHCQKHTWGKNAGTCGWLEEGEVKIEIRE
jgi:hypothetical protein